MTSKSCDFILNVMSDELIFLSVAEAAERLGLTRGRINQLINDEVLPARRVGRAFMIDERHLVHAKKRNTKKTGRPKKKENER